MIDANHVKCNKDELLKCQGLFAAWKLGVINALEQSNSTQIKSKAKMTCGEARNILHPGTTLQALAEIEYYAGFSGKEAKIKAVDEACLIACESLDRELIQRPCLVFGNDGVRHGIFHGFSDNNDKAVIEYEDGELHKAYVWRVQFIDKPKK